MSKRAQRRVKRKPRKVKGKNSFHHTVNRLKKLSRGAQVQAMSVANNRFIRDFVTHVKRLRHQKLSPKQQKVIQRHKLKLRKLVNRRTKLSSKRHLLSQKGGFLPALIPLIAAAAGPVVAAIVGQ